MMVNANGCLRSSTSVQHQYLHSGFKTVYIPASERQLAMDVGIHAEWERLIILSTQCEVKILYVLRVNSSVRWENLCFKIIWCILSPQTLQNLLILLSTSYKNVRKKKNPALFLVPESDIQLILTASAGVGHSLNPESSPPSLLKAFSLMPLQRWEKVAAQKGPESKGGIDPGKRPSFLSLPPASSSSSSPFCSLAVSSPFTSLCQFMFPLLFFRF